MSFEGTTSSVVRQRQRLIQLLWIVSLTVYIISHSNRCEPDAGTSDQRTKVTVSLFTDQNGLGMDRYEWQRMRGELSRLIWSYAEATSLECNTCGPVRQILQAPGPAAAPLMWSCVIYKGTWWITTGFVIKLLQRWETCLTARSDKTGTEWHAHK